MRLAFFFFLTTLLCVFIPFDGLNIVHGQRGVSVSEYVVSGQGKAGPNHMGNGRAVYNNRKRMCPSQ